MSILLMTVTTVPSSTVESIHQQQTKGQVCQILFLSYSKSVQASQSLSHLSLGNNLYSHPHLVGQRRRFAYPIFILCLLGRQCPLQTDRGGQENSLEGIWFYQEVCTSALPFLPRAQMRHLEQRWSCSSRKANLRVEGRTADDEAERDGEPGNHKAATPALECLAAGTWLFTWGKKKLTCVLFKQTPAFLLVFYIWLNPITADTWKFRKRVSRMIFDLETNLLQALFLASSFRFVSDSFPEELEH